MATYDIRLMFEWGGPCLWSMNAAAKTEYRYDNLEDLLPLSAETKARLVELTHLHDGALNLDDPAGPSPWTQVDFDRFEAKAKAILAILQAELGDAYTVWYDP